MEVAVEMEVEVPAAWPPKVKPGRQKWTMSQGPSPRAPGTRAFAWSSSLVPAFYSFALLFFSVHCCNNSLALHTVVFPTQPFLRNSFARRESRSAVASLEGLGASTNRDPFGRYAP